MTKNAIGHWALLVVDVTACEATYYDSYFKD